MNCETCNATASKPRDCVVKQHRHHLCNVCVWRYREGKGQPIRCPEVGWDGHPDESAAEPAAPEPKGESEQSSANDDRPPF